MGLFDKIKKQKEFNKQAEYKQGIIPTIVELYEDYMLLITQTNTDTVFYTDIMSVQQVPRVLNIRTNVKTYSLNASTDKVKELHLELMDKMRKNK